MKDCSRYRALPGNAARQALPADLGFRHGSERVAGATRAVRSQAEPGNEVVSEGVMQAMAAAVTITEALALAVKRHQAGDVGYAEEIYRRVLQADPAHGDARCYLAAVCLATDRPQEAAEHYQECSALIRNTPGPYRPTARPDREAQAGRAHARTAPGALRAGLGLRRAGQTPRNAGLLPRSPPPQARLQ